MTSTTNTTRETFTAADFGAAMVAHYTSTTPKGWRMRSDGVEGPASYRQGDNTASFRIVETRGVAMDARTGRSFSARAYAAEIVGCTLPEMMSRYGRTFSPSPPKAAQPEPDARALAVEAIGVWVVTGAVDDDGEVSAWLRSRGHDVGRIVDTDAARVIRQGAKVPKWAKCAGRSWSDAYRLVARLHDARGEPVSLHARRIVGDDTLPKTASPAGYTTRGLVMCNALARGLLAGFGGSRKLVVATSKDTKRPAVVVCEGLPAFLAWCTDASDADEHAPAVIGILSGSWTADHAERIPDGARVAIDTDHGDKNGDGDRYAAHIASTLEARAVELARFTRPAA